MSAARDLLEEWPRRFGGGMVAHDAAYFEAMRSGAMWPEASKAAGMALLEVFVEALEAREEDDCQARVAAIVGEVAERVASVHERVACPKCEAPRTITCRRMPQGYMRIDPYNSGVELKHPHPERLRADGIEPRCCVRNAV